MSDPSGTSKKLRATWWWIAGSAAGAVAILLWPRAAVKSPEQSFTPAKPLAVIEKIPLPSGPERQVADEIEGAIGKSTPLDKTSRLESLRRQDGTLGPVETEVLLAELLHPTPSGEGKAWESEYFHEICLLLQRRGEGNGKLARVLATVAADPGRDLRIRDYSIQHLRTVWAAADGDAALRASIQATFRSLLENQPRLAASALLSLHLLGADFNQGATADARDHHHALPDPELIPAVTGILNRPDPERRDTSLRMTALRVISERKIESLLPEVRKMAANEEGEHPVTRMAAIAALAQFAEPRDRALLESMSATDARIAGAVKHALTRIP